MARCRHSPGQAAPGFFVCFLNGTCGVWRTRRLGVSTDHLTHCCLLGVDCLSYRPPLPEPLTVRQFNAPALREPMASCGRGGLQGVSRALQVRRLPRLAQRGRSRARRRRSRVHIRGCESCAAGASAGACRAGRTGVHLRRGSSRADPRGRQTRVYVWRWRSDACSGPT